MKKKLSTKKKAAVAVALASAVAVSGALQLQAGASGRVPASKVQVKSHAGGITGLVSTPLTSRGGLVEQKLACSPGFIVTDVVAESFTQNGRTVAARQSKLSMRGDAFEYVWVNPANNAQARAVFTHGKTDISMDVWTRAGKGAVPTTVNFRANCQLDNAFGNAQAIKLSDTAQRLATQEAEVANVRDNFEGIVSIANDAFDTAVETRSQVGELSEMAITASTTAGTAADTASEALERATHAETKAEAARAAVNGLSDRQAEMQAHLSYLESQVSPGSHFTYTNTQFVEVKPGGAVQVFEVNCNKQTDERLTASWSYNSQDPADWNGVVAKTDSGILTNYGWDFPLANLTDKPITVELYANCREGAAVPD